MKQGLKTGHQPPPELAEAASLILTNYRRWLGLDLVEAEDPCEAIFQLWQTPRVVLSAIGPVGTDHSFNYANRAGLDLFETSLADLLGKPSSCSAEPMHQAERTHFLETVARQGFMENYSGIRISQKGRRFRIQNATVFNLVDGAGSYLGQAATFAEWEYLG